MTKRDLFNLTRSKGFLWKSSAVLAVFFIVLGSGLSFLNTDRIDAYEQILASSGYLEEYEGEIEGLQQPAMGDQLSIALREELISDRPFHEKLEDIEFLIFLSEVAQAPEMPAHEELSGWSKEKYEMMSAFVAAGFDRENDEALWMLMDFTEESYPIPGANYALALVYERRAMPEAVDALLREIKLHNSNPARQRLVNLFLDLKAVDRLEVLLEDPAFAPFIKNYALREIALAKMDWPMLVKTQLAATYEHVRMGMVLLALLSGAIWITILLRFNGTISLGSSCVKMAIPALLLGALSAHATILVIFAQEHYLNFTEGTDDLHRFIYCILGIGLREEGLKLLFFVPLLPFLRKKDDLEILAIAGLVGLGFAIEENIGYFQGSAGVSALGRFATANFLHLSLTALCGLSLARAFSHKANEIAQAAITFGLAVVAHGLYDAFIMVPMLEEYSMFTSTVFVLIGFQYFGWLKHLRDDWRDPISITAVFTFGIVVVTGISFCLFAWQVGAMLAFQAIGYEVLGVGIILIMFYREIPETLQ